MKRYIQVDFMCPNCKKPEKPHHAKGLCLDCYSSKNYREKVAKQSEKPDLCTGDACKDSTPEVE